MFSKNSISKNVQIGWYIGGEKKNLENFSPQPLYYRVVGKNIPVSLSIPTHPILTDWDRHQNLIRQNQLWCQDFTTSFEVVFCEEARCLLLFFSKFFNLCYVFHFFYIHALCMLEICKTENEYLTFSFIFKKCILVFEIL